MNTPSPRISIVIPTLNEAKGIGNLLRYLLNKCHLPIDSEILVVDGGSEDRTVAIASSFGVNVLHAPRGRAIQMNTGARRARGEILYFLHADTFPPPGFYTAIKQAVDKGHKAGSFRMKFDDNSLFLSFFSWFTRFNFVICRGGDQSLFVTRGLFNSIGGFNESYMIYEDNEIVSRLYHATPFIVLPEEVVTSARRYHQKQMLKLQFHFGVMHLKRHLGAGPDDLYRYYRKNIAI